MRARLSKKMSGRSCEIVPATNFFGYFPTMDYILCCDTAAAKRTIHRKRAVK